LEGPTPMKMEKVCIALNPVSDEERNNNNNNNNNNNTCL
jgi:hypothetical protein